MIKIKHINLETEYPKIYFFNVTDDVKKFITETGIKDGIVTVQSEHTTCAIFFEEYVHDEDPIGNDYLQIDLKRGLRKIFPNEEEFDDYYYYPGPKHMNRPGRTHFDFEGISLNGPAHLKSTLIGASQTFVIEDGVIQTGKFGSIWFVDFDYSRPRQRQCVICVMGE